MGQPTIEDIKRIEGKLDTILSFLGLSDKPRHNLVDLSLRAKRSAEKRRVKEGEREAQR